MKRSVFTTVGAVLLLTVFLALPARAAGTAFSDVPRDHWAAAEIGAFAERGVVNGKPDGTFAPEEKVTREQAVKLMALTFPEKVQPDFAAPAYSDVDNARWSAPLIARWGGALPGSGSGTFAPERPATREEMAVALARVLGLTAEDRNYAKKTFADGASIASSHLELVSAAVEAGLVTGLPDGSFGPGKSISRAETVVLLDRAVKFMEKAGQEQEKPKQELPDSGWLLLVEYAHTAAAGQVYWAVVDGQVAEVPTDEETLRALPAALEYDRTEDGLYDLRGSIDLVGRIGEVMLADRKSVIVGRNGQAEARMGEDTVTALLDGEDTELDAPISKGDVVALVTDRRNNALGIFILAEYDEDAADVVWCGPGVESRGLQIAADGEKLTSVGDLLSRVAFSGGSQVKVLSGEAPDPEETAFDDLSAMAPGDSLAGGAWVAVKPEGADGRAAGAESYQVYELTVNI